MYHFPWFVSGITWLIMGKVELLFCIIYKLWYSVIRDWFIHFAFWWLMRWGDRWVPWVEVYFGKIRSPSPFLIIIPKCHWIRHFVLTLQWRHNEHYRVSNHQPYNCLLNRLFRHRSKKTSKLRVTGFCAGNSPVTSEFHTQRASNAENVFIWWSHHVMAWCRTRTTNCYLGPLGPHTVLNTSMGPTYSTHQIWFPSYCNGIDSSSKEGSLDPLDS